MTSKLARVFGRFLCGFCRLKKGAIYWRAPFQLQKAPNHYSRVLIATLQPTPMTGPKPIYPTSFAATEGLTREQCHALDSLTEEQVAEFEVGRAYLFALNHPDARPGFVTKPLPTAFRIRLASYCEGRMARKTGIP